MNLTDSAREIAPGVYSLGQRMGGHVHAFLLDDGNGLTILDTLYDTDAHRVLEAIKALNRPITDLKNIVLTHAHRSHLGGLAVLKKQSGGTVYAHTWEADIIAGQREAQRVSPLPRSPLRVYPLQLGLALGFGKHPPCPVDRPLKDGDHVGPLDVLHVPGHTPGSLAFYWPDRKTLFAGDIIATWPRFEPGWKGFTLNFKQSRDSLGKLTEVSAAEILAVGHGEPVVGTGADQVRAAYKMAQTW
jgi:glyoxylase-like metal-dependent hydrolase (beta-lactamase superfamily II)